MEKYVVMLLYRCSKQMTCDQTNNLWLQENVKLVSTYMKTYKCMYLFTYLGIELNADVCLN